MHHDLGRFVTVLALVVISFVDLFALGTRWGGGIETESTPFYHLGERVEMKGTLLKKGNDPFVTVVFHPIGKDGSLQNASFTVVEEDSVAISPWLGEVVSVCLIVRTLPRPLRPGLAAIERIEAVAMEKNDP